MTSRLRIAVIGLMAMAALAALNIAAFGLDDRLADWRHQRTITSESYMRTHGRWERVDGPGAQQLNTVHMALLRTGRVLLIAGSGNDVDDFEAGRFRVGVFDPATGATRVLQVPTDIFCAGQAFLPDGRLLIAGGTTRYETLAADVTHAGGVLTLPAGGPEARRYTLPKGTRFTAPRTGEVVRTASAVRVGGPEVRVWVTAERPGTAPVAEGWEDLVEIRDPGVRRPPAHGRADRLTLDTRDYEGDRAAYVLDPVAETFTRVGDMARARWYPSLVTLDDGRVLAASGLDEFGRIIQGRNEVFDPATGRWTTLAHHRKFATYPALFTSSRPGVLFFAGSNSGYGSRRLGRTPGLWTWETGAFTRVPGLRDATMTETSGSLLLPPAQRQRFMVLGGGPVGDADGATARTDIVDLTDPRPAYRPGPSLPEPTRYPNAVVLPDDSTLVTGGASNYRATDGSALLVASLLDPSGTRLRRVADPTVPRSYHSSALLLPDGRVLTTGGDPLENADGTGPGEFERRMEVYSPPYLFRGPRPVLTGGPSVLARGATGTFTTPDAGRIARARLVRPGAVTHTTDLEQRSVALRVRPRPGAGAVDVTVPRGAGLTPGGWYMLFAVDRDGVPSVARWVRVPGGPEVGAGQGPGGGVGTATGGQSPVAGSIPRVRNDAVARGPVR